MSKAIKTTTKSATPTPETIASSTSSNKSYLIVVAMLALIALARFAYNNALDNQFVTWDDPMYVTENPMFLQYGKPNAPSVWTTPIALNYHPLTMKTLLWNGQNLGKKVETDAKPFISTNIWLHAFNSALVFLLFWFFTRGNWFVSLFGGIMFAVHPMHVESVAWVAERKDVLYAFFFLLALIAYLQFLENRKSLWFIFSLLLFILSCLSKAMAVSLVPVLLLIDWYRERPIRQMSIWLEKIPFVAVALFFGLIAFNIQGGGNFHGMLSGIEGVKSALSESGSFPFSQRIAFAAYGMVQYLIRFFVPFDLSPYYPYPPEAFHNQPIASSYYSYIMVFALIAALCIWSARYTKSILFGFAFYVATVILVAQIVSVGLVIMADRYTYLPYIGLSLGLLLWIDKYASAKKTFQYATWGVLAIFNIFWLNQTFKQTDIWQNTETLFGKARQLYPQNEDILNTLGLYYGKTGKLNESKACFEEAINGKYPVQRATIYEGLGNIYGMKNQSQQAIDMFTKAIALDPKRGTFYFNRAIAETNIDPIKAIEDLNTALPLMPLKDRGKVFLQIGACYLQSKQYQKVIENKAVMIKEDLATEYTYYQVGIAQYNMGNMAEATKELQQALSINPNFADAKAVLEKIK
jgi:protein O-mannosyl-transferase